MIQSHDIRIILQSTSLIRGKTNIPHPPHGSLFHFNPLPSSEGRPFVHAHWIVASMYFNPLPSSEGRQLTTISSSGKITTSIHFPHPREDCERTRKFTFFDTSIHFPHPREDGTAILSFTLISYFNPLPSSEGRLVHIWKHSNARQYFNPLPSSEGRLEERRNV